MRISRPPACPLGGMSRGRYCLSASLDDMRLPHEADSKPGTTPLSGGDVDPDLTDALAVPAGRHGQRDSISSHAYATLSEINTPPAKGESCPQPPEATMKITKYATIQPVSRELVQRDQPTTRGPRHRKPTTPLWRRIIGSRQAPKGRGQSAVAPHPTDQFDGTMKYYGLDQWERGT